MIYIVTAVKDINTESCGVEVAGIFDTEEKAYQVKDEIMEWLEDNRFEDHEVYVTPITINHLNWYEIEKDI